MLRLALLAGAAAGVAGASSWYTNPVSAETDSPDPGVAWCPEAGLYYAATTTGGDANHFRLRSSPDLIAWTDVGYVFPSGSAGTPKWAKTDFWAPELHYVAGGWTVYFTARHSNGQLSIGVARSSSGNITGPYTDSGAPLVMDSGAQHYGMIDATYFGDIDGRQYLVWKRDGNAVGAPTPIHIAELTPNGTAFAANGQPAWNSTALITNDLPFEGGVTEGPWIVHYANAYYLFYSANSYYDGTYAVGVARADAIRGPYTKMGFPILANATAVNGSPPPWQVGGSAEEMGDGTAYRPQGGAADRLRRSPCALDPRPSLPPFTLLTHH
jgi:arabinan endo-1,5-alpha-L-arabinosidase